MNAQKCLWQPKNEKLNLFQSWISEGMSNKLWYGCLKQVGKPICIDMRIYLQHILTYCGAVCFFKNINQNVRSISSPPLGNRIIDDCRGGHTFSQSKSSYKTVYFSTCRLWLAIWMALPVDHWQRWYNKRLAKNLYVGTCLLASPGTLLLPPQE